MLKLELILISTKWKNGVQFDNEEGGPARLRNTRQFSKDVLSAFFLENLLRDWAHRVQRYIHITQQSSRFFPIFIQRRCAQFLTFLYDRLMHILQKLAASKLIT